MAWFQKPSVKQAAGGFLRSLLRDRAGNTVMIVAGAMIPLLAIIGGGIDMGRSYLTESRLQQACDAGVLAARKKLGSTVVLDGLVPAAVATSGNKFFDINYRNGSYGTNNRNFVMTLESDYSISGAASVDVPTTVMKLFAFDKIPVKVRCEAKLNISNTDLMMVIDTTASMLTSTTLNTVTMTRMAALKKVVHDFYLQMDASRTAGTRIRYGFLPYSNNVNVGAQLQDAWVATTWNYQSRVRVADHVGTTYLNPQDENWVSVLNNSGAYGTYTVDEFRRYAGTWNPPTGETGVGYYSCPIAEPANDWSGTTDEVVVVRTETPAGSGIFLTKMKWKGNAVEYWQHLSGSDCITTRYRWQNYAETYDHWEQPYTPRYAAYDYKPIATTFTNWRTETQGCIEERATSNAHNFSDFTAIDVDNTYLDLNIDLVPTGNIATKWKPGSSLGRLSARDRLVRLWYAVACADP